MNAKTCTCNPCHKDTCGCASRGAGSPSEKNRCCCGVACGCGEACDCPAACGCNG